MQYLRLNNIKYRQEKHLPTIKSDQGCRDTADS